MYRLSELPEWHFNNCRWHGTLWSMNIGRYSQRLANTLMNSYHMSPGTKLFILKTETSVQGAKGPKSHDNRIRRRPNEEVFVTQPLESQVISNHLVLVTVSELSIVSHLRSLTCMEEKGCCSSAGSPCPGSAQAQIPTLSSALAAATVTLLASPKWKSELLACCQALRQRLRWSSTHSSVIIRILQIRRKSQGKSWDRPQETRPLHFDAWWGMTVEEYISNPHNPALESCVWCPGAMHFNLPEKA